MLVFNLITFEDKKDLVFIFDNFNFKTLILIVNENDKIFVFKTILKNDEIVNVAVNYIQKSFIKTNVRFVRYFLRLFDCARNIKIFINDNFK